MPGTLTNGAGTGHIAAQVDTTAADAIKPGADTAKAEKACAKCERLQASLAQALKQLAGCNRDLEQFSYVASHDLQ